MSKGNRLLKREEARHGPKQFDGVYFIVPEDWEGELPSPMHIRRSELSEHWEGLRYVIDLKLTQKKPGDDEDDTDEE